MDHLRELFRYHSWATRQLVDYCESQSAELVEEVVIGTDRSIGHTLTHIIGTEQEYLEELLGRQILPRVRAGQVFSLAEARDRSEVLSQHWNDALDRIAEIDITLPADGPQPVTAHGQNLLILQAIQHGIDHRTQIDTTLHFLHLEPPPIDGWAYWRSVHAADD